jgi:hypothetical protein
MNKKKKRGVEMEGRSMVSTALLAVLAVLAVLVLLAVAIQQQ